MPTSILHEKGNMTDLLQIEKQERTRSKVTTQHKNNPMADIGCHSKQARQKNMKNHFRKLLLKWYAYIPLRSITKSNLH